MRIGGYPRLWWRDGYHLDLPQIVPDEGVAEFEQRWRLVHVRVEWLQSPGKHLDHLLPQTLERQVHNARTFAWRERGERVSGGVVDP